MINGDYGQGILLHVRADFYGYHCPYHRDTGAATHQENRPSGRRDRHCTLIKAIAKVEKTFTEKLEDHCQKQEKLHKQIDERFWKHSHTLDENGQVTKDIIIKGGM